MPNSPQISKSPNNPQTPEIANNMAARYKAAFDTLLAKETKENQKLILGKPDNNRIVNNFVRRVAELAESETELKSFK